jgi:hypothetical protein
MLTQLRPITDQLKKTEGIIIPVYVSQIFRKLICSLDLKIQKPEEGSDSGSVSNRPMYEPTVVVDFGEKSVTDKSASNKTEVQPA